MSIYASVVALWFMAVALFLIGALIRAWFRSPRGRVRGRICPFDAHRFWGNNRFTYEFFAVLSLLAFDVLAKHQRTNQPSHIVAAALFDLSGAFAVQRALLRKSRNKTGNGQTPESGLTSESQSIATLALSVVALLLRQPF